VWTKKTTSSDHCRTSCACCTEPGWVPSTPTGWSRTSHPWQYGQCRRSRPHRSWTPGISGSSSWTPVATRRRVCEQPDQRLPLSAGEQPSQPRLDARVDGIRVVLDGTGAAVWRTLLGLAFKERDRVPAHVADRVQGEVFPAPIVVIQAPMTDAGALQDHRRVVASNPRSASSAHAAATSFCLLSYAGRPDPAASPHSDSPPGPTCARCITTIP
jgi:hypothetical protein